MGSHHASLHACIAACVCLRACTQAALDAALDVRRRMDAAALTTARRLMAHPAASLGLTGMLGLHVAAQRAAAATAATATGKVQATQQHSSRRTRHLHAASAIRTADMDGQQHHMRSPHDDEGLQIMADASAMDGLARLLVSEPLLQRPRPGVPLVDDWDCLRGMVGAWQAACGPMGEYGMRHTRMLANLCNAGVRPMALMEVMADGEEGAVCEGQRP